MRIARLIRQSPPRARWIATVCYAVLVAFASLLPRVKQRPNILLPPHIDKVAHFAAYALLAAALSWALSSRLPRCRPARASTLVFCALYGAALEALQAVLAPLGRDFSAFDLVANIAGAAVCLTIIAAAENRRQRSLFT